MIQEITSQKNQEMKKNSDLMAEKRELELRIDNLLQNSSKAALEYEISDLKNKIFILEKAQLEPNYNARPSTSHSSYQDDAHYRYKSQVPNQKKRKLGSEELGYYTKEKKMNF